MRESVEHKIPEIFATGLKNMQTREWKTKAVLRGALNSKLLAYKQLEKAEGSQEDIHMQGKKDIKHIQAGTIVYPKF